MAFPVVQATATSEEAVNIESHTVSLPTGIGVDDLLVVIFATADTTVTFPAGWTSIFNLRDVGRDKRTVVYYRRADGTEGSSITVTTSTSKQSGHNAYRITGWEDPSTQAPEVSTGATGADANPNPDSLTPTGGAKDYLWIAFSSTEGNTTAIPTSYTDELDSTGTANRRASSARRELNATSEDPGTFTNEFTGWTAGTVAIHPGALPSAIAVESGCTCCGFCPPLDAITYLHDFNCASLNH